ncbi:MAG: hypothetical protein IPM59_09940 [Chloracidobacterium sp.]|nr:hypothetical protein [Chloracidobacterium sp.]
MMLKLFLIDLSRFRPESIFGGQILERTPAGLSIIYLFAVAILLAFLILTFIENFRRRKFTFERDLPSKAARKLTQTIANRSLMVWQVVFVILALFVFGSQFYWAFYADEWDEKFSELSYKDLRNRRINAASLRGWMLDRSGTLQNALAYYKLDKDGNIDRTFSLDKEMAHLLGTERGSPGLERSLYKQEADPMPEAWEILTKYKKPQPENRDVKITIDKNLQAFVAKQLGDRNGAVVILNPQTGDLLAAYSNPSYKLSDAESLAGWLKLEADKKNKPTLNRTLHEFYMPGSTFKTFTMISAYRAGKQNADLPQGVPGEPCYTPFRGSRPICDGHGGCHSCGGPIRDAFRQSSNQFFSRMANALGRERMAETATVFGIAPVETSEDALKQGRFADIWNVSNRRLANALAPARSAITTGAKLNLYESAIIGMGQGGAGTVTPLQLALIASAPANMEGRLMKPRIEMDQPPQAFSQVLSPQQAREIRDIMSTVTQEAGGTATRALAKVMGAGISTGGKTGTADRDVPKYDDKGKVVKRPVRKKNQETGEYYEELQTVLWQRWDGLFLCIAPVENPLIAMMVAVENIGEGRYGGDTAAPIAANILLEARRLGLLGGPAAPARR